MIYSRKRLLEWAVNGGITPFDESMLGDRPNEHCLDVRLGCLAPTLDDLPLVPPTNYFQQTLRAGECSLGLLLESVKMPPDAVGKFTIRSMWAKQWFGQVLSQDIKAGWQGHLVVELKNYHHITPLVLSYNLAIGQISLEDIG